MTDGYVDESIAEVLPAVGRALLADESGTLLMNAKRWFISSLHAERRKQWKKEERSKKLKNKSPEDGAGANDKETQTEAPEEDSMDLSWSSASEVSSDSDGPPTARLLATGVWKSMPLLLGLAARKGLGPSAGGGAGAGGASGNAGTTAPEGGGGGGDDDAAERRKRKKKRKKKRKTKAKNRSSSTRKKRGKRKRRGR